jgi:putative colanic acid biosysnthesis UDP-glucose lipid carrier transferase
LRTQERSNPNLSNLSLRAAFAPLDELGLADVSGFPAKRVLDVTLALAALLLTLPLLALITLAIALDSRGPVLFAQRRIGLGGQPFAILKFRSMKVLEDGAENTQAVEGDARITRIGRLLRASSLDELPQLFNVLAGDMSLVGPRPHAAAHDEYYASHLADYRLRHLVKPGITGWAQIHRARGATPTLKHMQARIDLDIFYIAHESVTFDLRILARTPLAVLSHRNAY